MEGASFVSKKTGEFSPENSWVKIAWMQFLPALQGSACASLPNGNGYAALPIGARLFGKKDFSSANENVAKKARQALEGWAKAHCKAMEWAGPHGTPEAPHKGHVLQQKKQTVPRASAAKKKKKMLSLNKFEFYLQKKKSGL